MDEQPPKLDYARPLPHNASGQMFARHMAVMVGIAGTFAAIGTAAIVALRWLGIW